MTFPTSSLDHVLLPNAVIVVVVGEWPRTMIRNGRLSMTIDWVEPPRSRRVHRTGRCPGVFNNVNLYRFHHIHVDIRPRY